MRVLARFILVFYALMLFFGMSMNAMNSSNLKLQKDLSSFPTDSNLSKGTLALLHSDIIYLDDSSENTFIFDYKHDRNLVSKSTMGYSHLSKSTNLTYNINNAMYRANLFNQKHLIYKTLESYGFNKSVQCNKYYTNYLCNSCLNSIIV